MIPSAIEVRDLEAKSSPEYFGSTVYRVEGRNGLYRRIPRTGSGLKTNRPGAVVCHRDDSLIELAPWDGLNDQLAKAGYSLQTPPPADVPPAAPPTAPELFPTDEIV